MKKTKILSAVLSLMVGITALATVPVFESVYATNEIKTETSDENVKLSIKNSEQELSQKDIITLEIGVPLVLEYTASGKPEISTETNDIETVVNEDAKTITITANNTTYSRVNVIVPSTNESLYFTVTALHADYRTVTEYDDSPLHVGEMREIHFYHPKTKTATTADILEVSDNISVQYEKGNDYLTIKALESGNAKLYIRCDDCAFGAYVYINIISNEPVFGDANCDNELSMADAVLIMQSIANPAKFGIEGTDENHITKQGKKNADITGENDGITNADALAIQKKLLKLD